VFTAVLAALFVPPAPLIGRAADAPRTLSVLVGAGQDTVAVNSFFPRDVRIRAGDSITWRQNSDSPHTVSFLGAFPGPGNPNVFSDPHDAPLPGTNIPVPGQPGETMNNPMQIWPYPNASVFGSTYRGGTFASSGRFVATPPTPGVDPITTFTLTFDTPGTYRYICLTHVNTMIGTVDVVSASASDVPSQVDLDARAKADIDALMTLVDRERAQRSNVRSEPGPNDSTIWYVSAGPNFFRINDERAQIDEFLPRDLTIASGDTVLWASTGFHAVTFNPAPPPPPLNTVETLSDGSRAVIQNRVAFDPVKPSGVFDPSQFYNSGNLSAGQPNGTAWALTFETPGTFEYYCAVHRERGMIGTITVTGR
jgi:plastocyanin